MYNAGWEAIFGAAVVGTGAVFHFKKGQKALQKRTEHHWVELIMNESFINYKLLDEDRKIE
jgi:hypothetical protein